MPAITERRSVCSPWLRSRGLIEGPTPARSCTARRACPLHGSEATASLKDQFGAPHAGIKEQADFPWLQFLSMNVLELMQFVPTCRELASKVDPLVQERHRLTSRLLASSWLIRCAISWARSPLIEVFRLAARIRESGY
jgi:hypothetical protein